MRIPSIQILICLVFAGWSLSEAASRPQVPDLTQGGQPDGLHDWNLGPTGARGWIWGWKGKHEFKLVDAIIGWMDTLLRNYEAY